MTAKSPSCRAIELDLVATATGEAESRSAERVQRHLDTCGSCRDDFDRLRTGDSVVARLRELECPQPDFDRPFRVANTGQLVREHKQRRERP